MSTHAPAANDGPAWYFEYLVPVVGNVDDVREELAILDALRVHAVLSMYRRT